MTKNSRLRHRPGPARGAVEAGLATAAAPVAFSHVRTERHGDLLNGGLWANTPVLVGLIEAKRYFKQDLANVRVLSIGTTRSKLSPRRPWQLGGVVKCGGLLRGRLQDLLWEGQRHLAIGAAGLLLLEDGLIHVDHEFAGFGYKIMDASRSEVRALEQAGRAEAQKRSAEVCQQFFAESGAALSSRSLEPGRLKGVILTSAAS